MKIFYKYFFCKYTSKLEIESEAVIVSRKTFDVFTYLMILACGFPQQTSY